MSRYCVQNTQYLKTYHFVLLQWNQNTHFIFTVSCQRVCPGGRPSKNCSYCICDGQTLHGEVFSVTGVPVPNATVALASQAKVVHAHTDAKGQFKIDGLCTSPQTRVVIRKDKFAPITLPVSNNSTDELWVRAILRSSGKEKKKPLDMDDPTLIFLCNVALLVSPFYVLQKSHILISTRKTKCVMWDNVQPFAVEQQDHQNLTNITGKKQWSFFIGFLTNTVNLKVT